MPVSVDDAADMLEGFLLWIQSGKTGFDLLQQGIWILHVVNWIACGNGFADDCLWLSDTIDQPVLIANALSAYYCY